MRSLVARGVTHLRPKADTARKMFRAQQRMSSGDDWKERECEVPGMEVDRIQPMRSRKRCARRKVLYLASA